MKDPCENNDCSDPNVVRRFGCLKWLALGSLFALLGLLLLRGIGSDVKPTLEMPASEALTGTINFSGSSQVGANIQLLNNGQPIARTVADNAGIWSLSPSLPPGQHELVVQEVTSNGRVVTTSDPQSINILTTPTLVLPESISDPGTILLSGIGTRASNIAILNNGEVIGNTLVDHQGHWVFEANVDAGSANEFVAQLIGSSGGMLGQSLPAFLTIPDSFSEQPAPGLPNPEATPVAAEPDPEPRQPPTLSFSEEEGTEAGIVFKGNAEPGTPVQIIIDGAVVDAVIADDAGIWRYSHQLSAGDYEIVARSNFPDGSSLDSASQTVTIGQSNLIAVAEHAGNFTLWRQTIEVVGLTDSLQNDGPYTVFAPNDAAFAKLPAGTLAAWQTNPTFLWRIMAYHIANGSISSESFAPGQIVETTLQRQLQLQRSEDGTHWLIEDGCIKTVDLPAANGLLHAINTILLPPIDGIDPPVIDETGVPIYDGNPLTVVGTATPGTTLLLEIDGEEFGRTLVGTDGEWPWVVSEEINAGTHEIIAYTLNEDGLLVAQSVPVILIVE